MGLINVKKQGANNAMRTGVLALLLAMLAACGSGSGAGTSANPVTDTPDVANYTGPAPQTADVQAFKLAVWDNLVPNNRCGSCHNDSQSPRFVRADDINLAYSEANTIVDLSDPADSIIVAKVRSGHNCWLSDDNACGDIVQSYIENWAGDANGSGQQIVLEAPPIRDPGNSKNFPADSALFAANVYPLLEQYCQGCHTDSAAVPQSPFFASEDVDAAYAAAQTRIDLETPANSRFVVRLRSEFHNCWNGDCPSSANEMEAAITALADAITPTQVDPSLVTSKALTLTDGIVSSAGGRHESNVIALYEFKTGSGNTVFDTSGIEPSLNLQLSGDYSWVGGWGVQFTAGKAQGSTTASAKLRDLITATGEYSIEAWVAPGNVTQDGPARIVTYSGGSMSRNFMLGQTLYNYDTFNRSDQTDQNGEPQLSTPDADEILQATLQHVVFTYDPANGRQIYVNGMLVDNTVDTVPGGLLNDWDDTFAFALASEVDNDNRWAGTVRLVAIHNRALTPEQVSQNFDVGVGERYYLLFNVSDHVGTQDAYVVFEVSQFDSYGYLFDEPFFVILDSAATPGSIPMAGIRIGLNGREAAVGQAFANVDVTIDDATYAVEGLQYLSTLGTVVPLEKGPTLDEFFLTFEVLGSSTNVVVEADPAPLPEPPDQPRDPELGIRDFAEINATMSLMTGIPAANSEVATTYGLVRQAMPVSTSISGFISSQQMGVTQLAIKYCSVLVDDPIARSTYFPGFPFAADSSIAFTDRDLLLDPLINNMVGVGISTQPDLADLRAEVNALVDDLIACGGSCEADRTERVVKAACASVLGSAAMLVQ